MKILLIGGSGFIGTRLSKRLMSQADKSIFIIDKVKSSLSKCDQILFDIVNPIDESVGPSSAEVLINLAAEHRDNVTPKSRYHDVNVTGAVNVCNFARKKNVSKIIFTSSVAVYGFNKIGSDESGLINPFGDYGKTKWEAEGIYKKWQAEDPKIRTLVIVRPTVVFGERNRGNVYNLLHQIVSGRFLMIGDGLNKKSMAYVENVAAFLEFLIEFEPGVHIYNYVDKPDFSMNALVAYVNKLIGRSVYIKVRLPFFMGLIAGYIFDLISNLSRRKFPISAIRVRKFCANSVYESTVEATGFVPPVPIIEAIEKTINFEFIEDHKTKHIFYSE